jgi:Tfp pilus assembly PilM family ATPase
MQAGVRSELRLYALLAVLPYAGSLDQRSPEMTRLAALMPVGNKVSELNFIFQWKKKMGKQAALTDRDQACQRRDGRTRPRLEQRHCNSARVRGELEEA